MWRIDGFSPQDLQIDGWIFHDISWFFAHKKLINPSQELFLCLLIKNRRSIPAAETGRDFGLRRLRNLNSKISPKGRKQELQNSTILFHQQRECGIFLLKRQGETTHLPAFNAWRPLLPPVPAPVPAPENPCLQLRMNRKNSHSLERSNEVHSAAVFQSQLLRSFRALGEWLLSKGVFAKANYPFSFYWNQHFLTEILWRKYIPWSSLSDASGSIWHWRQKSHVRPWDLGARARGLLIQSPWKIGVSHAMLKHGSISRLYTILQFQGFKIDIPPRKTNKGWYTLFNLWVLLESWHFRKELALKEKWKAKQRAHSPWLQILHALEMKGSASYHFHIFNFKSFWLKKIQVTKEAVPSFHFLDFFSWLAEPGKTFWEKERGILKAYHLYISPNEPSSLSCLSSHPERQKQHHELPAILCKEASTSTLDHKKKGKCLQYSGR